MTVSYWSNRAELQMGFWAHRPKRKDNGATLNGGINRTLADHLFVDKEESLSQDEGVFVVGIASF